MQQVSDLIAHVLLNIPVCFGQITGLDYAKPTQYPMHMSIDGKGWQPQRE
tara:strand:- start:7 stop:156 length:150 start_codon:yes stop_codon:yes gene_type:complete